MAKNVPKIYGSGPDIVRALRVSPSGEPEITNHFRVIALIELADDVLIPQYLHKDGLWYPYEAELSPENCFESEAAAELAIARALFTCH